jgi:outer membrane protein assembly factor BamA
VLATLRARGAEAAEPSQEPPRRSKTEFAALPVVGGDSDVGIGGGVITSLARVRPDLEPYLWRLEVAGTTTVKRITEGDWDVRYADLHLMLKLPHVIRDRLGLTLRASYTEETELSYYGLGNAADVGGAGQNASYYAFDWTHPEAEIGSETQLGAGFELTGGTSYAHNQINAPADGKLVQDSQSPDAELRHLTWLVPEHDVVTFSLGLNWDTRDDEVSPERGFFHSLRFDLSPRLGEQVPYDWARANLALRQYVPLWPGRLVAAVRVLADALLGQPPFYELARYDSTFAVGGTRGMRGVPAPGYYGMLKLIANIELRSRLFAFDLFDKRYELGLVAFTDLGRVFADYGELTELDGSGLGVKVSFGGGVRVRAGKSFVLRADLAGSPGEGSTGAYLTAGHMF